MDKDQKACCLGHYDFDHIAAFARRRFIDNESTIKLMQEARSQTEREEVALVSMLDIEDQYVLDLQLDCRHASHCKVLNCRDRLRRLIEAEQRIRTGNQSIQN